MAVYLDEMGPESAESAPGRGVARAEPGADADGDRRPAGRAKRGVDSGRRGKGYIFGASRPATGEAFTRPDASRSASDRADFLGHVEAWAPAGVGRAYAALDHPSAHRAADVLLSGPAHRR